MRNNILLQVCNLEAKSSTQIVRFYIQCLPIAFTILPICVEVWKKIENPKMFVRTRRMQL